MNPQDTAPSSPLISRRSALQGLGALAAVAATGLGSGALASKGHQHHGHGISDKRKALIDDAMHCNKTGELCVQHCFEMFKAGDTTLAECAESVNIMMAACDALIQMALYNSEHLKAQAKVCIGALSSCEEQCRKHEEDHPQCKDCGDACVACVESCEAILA